MSPVEPTPATFGQTLQRLRRAAGLSQEELAERAGVSARAVSDLERGVRRVPRPATLRLLAAALALSEPDRALLVAAANADVSRPAALLAPQAAVALPRPATPLLGREAEVDEVSDLLRRPEGRLVTLTGMGGIGKTRLALEIAHRLAGAFTGGVAFVDLSPISDPALVVPTIASVLGLRDPGDRPILESVTAGLRERELLLILDNCEQVLGATPELAALLASCHSLAVLATSREALRLRGEREWPVMPLPLPQGTDQLPPEVLLQSPAVALLVERAQARDPRFAFSAENAAAVTTICHRVEGVPLALELAAARLTLLSPEVLAARLEHPLPLLTGGTRDAPARQRTLRDTIAWSFGLLTSEEQGLFRRLAVFVGGWTLEAAEAVSNTTGGLDVLDGLGSLLDKSLIRREGHGPAGRYSMFETVREFARERLVASGEEPQVRHAHAAYFQALGDRFAAAVLGPEQANWLGLLEADHPNVRYAFATLERNADGTGSLRLTNALLWFWYMNAHAREGLPRFEQALNGSPERTLERAQALHGAATLAYARGAYSRADGWLEEAEALARVLGERALLAHCALTRGAIAEHRGDEAGAERAFASGLTVAQEAGSDWLVGVLLGNLADAAYRRGDLALAEQYVLAAVPVLQRSGNAYMESLNLGTIAQVALARGAVTQALAALAQGLEIAESIDSRLNRANIVAGSAAVCGRLGRYRQAARLLAAADAERERSGHSQLPNFGLYAETNGSLRRHLAAADYQEAWEEGSALTFSEVLAEVRDLCAQAHPAAHTDV